MNRYRPSSRAFRPALNRLEGRDNPDTTFQAFGAAAGGVPLVEVNRPDGSTLARFAAFDPAFRGGVRAAAGELDGDPNTVEVIAAAGPGGGPHVRVYSIDADDGEVFEVASFFAFEPGFSGGVRVAAGNVAGFDTRDEIVVAADAGGGPRVRVFGLTDSGAAPVGGPLADFFAFEPGFLGGVRVSAGELDGNPLDGDELIVAAGPGGGPRVRVLRSDGATLADYFAFREDFRGGVNVAVDGTGPVGRVLPDAEAADVSQRSAELNSAAFAAATPTPTGTTATTGGTGLFGSGFTGGLQGLGPLNSPFPVGPGLFTTTGGLNQFSLVSGLVNPPLVIGNATIGPSFGSSGMFGGFGDPGPLTPFPGLTGTPFFGTPFTGLVTPTTFTV